MWCVLAGFVVFVSMFFFLGKLRVSMGGDVLVSCVL